MFFRVLLLFIARWSFSAVIFAEQNLRTVNEDASEAAMKVIMNVINANKVALPTITVPTKSAKDIKVAAEKFQQKKSTEGTIKYHYNGYFQTVATQNKQCRDTERSYVDDSFKIGRCFGVSSPNAVNFASFYFTLSVNNKDKEYDLNVNTFLDAHCQEFYHDYVYKSVSFCENGIQGTWHSAAMLQQGILGQFRYGSGCSKNTFYNTSLIPLGVCVNDPESKDSLILNGCRTNKNGDVRVDLRHYKKENCVGSFQGVKNKVLFEAADVCDKSAAVSINYLCAK